MGLDRRAAIPRCEHCVSGGERWWDLGSAPGPCRPLTLGAATHTRRPGATISSSTCLRKTSSSLLGRSRPSSAPPSRRPELELHRCIIRGSTGTVRPAHLGQRGGPCITTSPGPRRARATETGVASLGQGGRARVTSRRRECVGAARGARLRRERCEQNRNNDRRSHRGP